MHESDGCKLDYPLRFTEMSKCNVHVESLQVQILERTYENVHVPQSVSNFSAISCLERKISLKRKRSEKLSLEKMSFGVHDFDIRN